MLYILFRYIVCSCDRLKYLQMKHFDGPYEDAQSSNKVWNYTMSAVTAQEVYTSSFSKEIQSYNGCVCFCVRVPISLLPQVLAKFISL